MTEQKTPFYESMTKHVVGGYMLRVWRACDEFPEGPDLEVLEVLKKLDYEETMKDYNDGKKLNHAEICDALIKGVPRVAAIEILDINGNGGVGYFESSMANKIIMFFMKNLLY